MQTSFNPSSVASSLQHPCNNNVLRLFLPVSCTKSTLNQKEWHVATKRLTFKYIFEYLLPDPPDPDPNIQISADPESETRPDMLQQDLP